MVLFLSVLAVTLAAYGVFVWSQHSGTHFFCVWLAFAALSALAAVAHANGAWAQLPVQARVAIELVTVAYAAWAVGLSCAIMREAAREKSAPGDLDVLIVLGAQVRPDRTPTNVLRLRLDTARSYLEAHPRCRCVVSGGKGWNEPISEASCMADYLVRNGIARNRIAEEDQSRSTIENMRFSRTLLADGERVGVVTNDFHLHRSLKIARREGIADPRGIAAPSTRPYLPNNLLRECLCLAWDVLRRA